MGFYACFLENIYEGEAVVTVKGRHAATSLLEWDFFVANESMSGFRVGSKAHVNEVGALLSSIFNV